MCVFVYLNGVDIGNTGDFSLFKKPSDDALLKRYETPFTRIEMRKSKSGTPKSATISCMILRNRGVSGILQIISKHRSCATRAATLLIADHYDQQKCIISNRNNRFVCISFSAFCWSLIFGTDLKCLLQFRFVDTT